MFNTKEYVTTASYSLSQFRKNYYFKGDASNKLNVLISLLT